MKTIKILKVTLFITAISIFIFNACAPLREFGTMSAYQNANTFTYTPPAYDPAKKTVAILANNDGTELFDMMAPFYLFNTTQKANVYIIAKNKFPIVVKKGLFLLPQSTFAEMDSLHINPDVIVIPYLSASDSLHQDPVIINWIKKHYTTDVKILSVCDGSATAAATGIFDGKPITAHASDYEGIKAHFSKPVWVKNIGVANEGNLYSTAGVSNATDGALTVIDKLFGSDIMQKVSKDVNYPHPFPQKEHQSQTFSFSHKMAVGKKLILRGNKKVGVLLQNGINEFSLAAIMDTYNRTFPKSIESFAANDQPIKTKYGLTLIPTGKLNKTDLDELHIINPHSFPENQTAFRSAKLIKYDSLQKDYIIDACLHQIRFDYGRKFKNVVKLMLDYN
jgi:transcriptional regulator GlxA family with amidase domain